MNFYIFIPLILLSAVYKILLRTAWVPEWDLFLILLSSGTLSIFNKDFKNFFICVLVPSLVMLWGLKEMVEPLFPPDPLNLLIARSISVIVLFSFPLLFLNRSVRLVGISNEGEVFRLRRSQDILSRDLTLAKRLINEVSLENKSLDSILKSCQEELHGKRVDSEKFRLLEKLLTDIKNGTPHDKVSKKHPGYSSLYDLLYEVYSPLKEDSQTKENPSIVTTSNKPKSNES